MIGIIDYGMGNIHSVQKALESQGASCLVTNNPKELKKFDKLVLPGVGAFDDAVAELESRGLIEAIKEYVLEGKILFGICLGLQLFFETSEEAKQKRGLGILKGQIKKFSEKSGLKIPQMGWNGLELVKPECPLFKEAQKNRFVYFCHSFYAAPLDKNIIAATCNYGMNFAAVVWQDNIFGVQFHPEKSQDFGLKLLKNFILL